MRDFSSAPGARRAAGACARDKAGFGSGRASSDRGSRTTLGRKRSTCAPSCGLRATHAGLRGSFAVLGAMVDAKHPLGEARARAIAAETCAPAHFTAHGEVVGGLHATPIAFAIADPSTTPPVMSACVAPSTSFESAAY